LKKIKIEATFGLWARVQANKTMSYSWAWAEIYECWPTAEYGYHGRWINRIMFQAQGSETIGDVLEIFKQVLNGERLATTAKIPTERVVFEPVSIKAKLAYGGPDYGGDHYIYSPEITQMDAPLHSHFPKSSDFYEPCFIFKIILKYQIPTLQQLCMKRLTQEERGWFESVVMHA